MFSPPREIIQNRRFTVNPESKPRNKAYAKFINRFSKSKITKKNTVDSSFLSPKLVMNERLEMVNNPKLQLQQENIQFYLKDQMNSFKQRDGIPDNNMVTTPEIAYKNMPKFKKLSKAEFKQARRHSVGPSIEAPKLLDKVKE